MFDETTTVSSAELARLLGCTERVLRNYKARGLLIAAGRGQYRLTASLQGLFRHFAEVSAGRAPSSGKLDLQQESAALKQAQRRLAEIKAAELEGKLVPVEQISPGWERVARTVRQGVLGIPGRARFALPHLTAVDSEVLMDLVREVLTDISETEAPALEKDGEHQ
jgi:phage terminase Nu1 subunit (DNA packaging protein)